MNGICLGVVAAAVAAASHVDAALTTSTEIVGKARFTLLADRMARCEWSADGRFEDRPSIVFINRDMPPVKHTLTRRGDGAVIETDRMRLEWTGGAFTAENLTVNGVAVLSEDKENLLGTMRTIDGRSSIPDLLPRMEKGILSRRGVTVVDDTATPLFVKGGEYWKAWVTERPREPQYRDLTIFAYGHDYKGCLGDYVKVAGRIPLPPRWAFGYWWSRFWPDSDSDYREVVRTMDSLGIPMDVCVIEMYWHETWNIGDRPDLRDESGQRVGWGGYTWNRRYFPDPKATFRFLHDNGLKAPLNMHPACGIPPMEECFGRFASDYGWKGTNAIPFRAEEERWAEVFFKDVVEPLEADGADFFWLDWQQKLMSKGMPTLSNTFWLNHLFNTHDANRRGGSKRPIIYHRWGGLGSHRYQIGFSGDGKVSWSMLEAIPWFTATASNVGYGYWGHDLGGHMKPEGDDGANGELYTRWMQCGVFTPIFRTHTTKDRRLERRIWKFADHFLTLREAFRLRYRLAPYIYTAAREAYDTGVSMCRPMYYDWPDENAAYDFINQYMFGNDILVAPVAKAADPVTKEAEVEVWLPEGAWYDVSRGELVDGGRRLKRGYTVEETPWFVKAGAVIPMYPDSVNRLGNPGTDDLVLFCAPNHLTTQPLNHLTIYEDDGDNADYATNFRRTSIRREGNRVTIAPRKGAYTLKFPLAAVPNGVKVNGKECAWEYDADDLSVVVKTPPQDGTHETVVDLVYSGEPQSPVASELSGLKGEYRRVTALTEEFRKALAGYGPGSKRRGARPEYVANLPDTWQVVWKTRDAVAAHPADARRLLAERDAALKAFAEKDWPRLEKALASEFIERMRAWLLPRKGRTEEGACACAVSPDGRNELRLEVGDEGIAYSILHNGKTLVEPTTISLVTREHGRMDGRGGKPKVTTRKVEGTVATPLYKKASVDLSANETRVDFGKWALVLHSRNDGVAWRFETKYEGEITVTAENTDVVFPQGATLCYSQEGHFQTGWERPAKIGTVESVKPGHPQIVMTPFTATVPGAGVFSMTESNLLDYPGLNFFRRDNEPNRLRSWQAGVPSKVDVGRRMTNVKSRHNYLAKTKGTRAFPWRVFVIGDSPSDLVSSDAVYALASPPPNHLTTQPPNHPTDFSWVKPGQVAWDWWNGFKITDVPGLNTGCNFETYKEYINFAAANGIAYIIMDEGWAEKLDLDKPRDNVNVPGVIAYAKEKGVDVILWAAWAQLMDREKRLRVFDRYGAMGAKGFKIDFMNRDDQLLEKFLEETAADAAERKLVVLYHGIHKPTGLCRTYPNVLNYEGVYGLEQGHSIGGRKVVVSNDVNLVYTRMIAGAMDYTPGAMRNRAFDAPKFEKERDARACYGTRCHQLALFPLFEAPVQMLCDSPTQYRTAPECTAFITKVPTVWDETVGVAGEIGKYAAIARRKGDRWWLGAITNWDAREVELPTAFLGDGVWKVEAFEDAPDADKNAERYVRREFNMKAGEPIKVRLAPGGGFAAKFTR